MSRSKHVTRRSFREELRWQYRDREEHREQVRRHYDELQEKRALKRASRQGALPVLEQPMQIPISVEERGPYLHYPLEVEELEAFLKRVAGMADGLEGIELRLGAEHCQSHAEREGGFALDPLVGRAGLEFLPGVYGGASLGVYFGERPLIHLFAYVYDQPQHRRVKEIYLKLQFLSTLVHELAHHFDHCHRQKKGRWRQTPGEKAEIYAEGEEARQLLDTIVPFLRERFGDEVEFLERWLEEQAGVPIPFEWLVGEPRTTAQALTLWAFSIAEAFGGLLEDLEDGIPRLQARRNFAEMVHFGDRFELALQILDTVLAEAPQDLGARIDRADMLQHLGRHPEALELVNDVLREAPEDPEAWRVRELIAWDTGDWQAVLQACDQEQRLRGKKWLSALSDRTRALVELGRYPEALDSAEQLRALGKPVGAARAAGFEALALLRQQKFEQALRLCETTRAEAAEVRQNGWGLLAAVAYTVRRRKGEEVPLQPLTLEFLWCQRYFEWFAELLVSAFEDTSLPFDAWDHRAHLTVAYSYLSERPLEVAIEMLRHHIQRYNAAHDVPTTPTRGYHETLTQMWARLVAAQVGQGATLVETVEGLKEKKLPLTYYSRDRLMSRQARYGWLEPDRTPLPSL